MKKLLADRQTKKDQHDGFHDALIGTKKITGATSLTIHLKRKHNSPQRFLSISGREPTENE
ncbi:hypothetical protein [Corynebacterium sp. 11A]|uniref:hypothetical protein n=1 Tax=Corynebacterium sp. 11A TaxID=2080510 RepID=UPI00124D8101|nr:hypothetical protein [Corynebacterium sp. 11A]